MTAQKMTPAEVLAAIDDAVWYMGAALGEKASGAAKLSQARTAVAALIAERDDAIRARDIGRAMASDLMRSCEALEAERDSLRTELRTMVDYANSPDFDGAPSRAAYERAVAVLERAEAGHG